MTRNKGVRNNSSKAREKGLMQGEREREKAPMKGEKKLFC